MGGRPPARQETRLFVICQAIRELFEGRSNAVGEVTLTASDTTTDVTAPNIGADSKVFLMPLTADAAAEVAAGGLYISAVAAGTFRITHANDASEDRDFAWVALG